MVSEFIENIAKEFEYKGFKCLIRKNYSLLVGTYSMGYVDITESNIKKKEYDFEFYCDLGFNQEITFCEYVDKRFLIGFDTAHSYNTQEDRTIESVEEEIKKIVDRIIEMEKGETKK